MTNKLFFFLAGFVLGAFVVGFVFYWKSEGLKRKTTISSSAGQILTKASDKLIEEKVKQDIKTINNDTINKHVNTTEATKKAHSEKVQAHAVVTKQDSVSNDTSFTSDSDRFIIRKDEMINERDIAVINIGKQKQANTSDSLLEKISGIKDETNKSEILKIEFWLSPINYKGYKMSKNKIVLFGMNPDDTLKLYSNEDAIYMEQSKNYFKMNYTDDFKPLEKITDSLIIQSLK